MAWARGEGNEAAARIAHRPSEGAATDLILPASPMSGLADAGSACGPMAPCSGPDAAAFERGHDVEALRGASRGFRS